MNNQPPEARFSYLLTSILWTVVTVGLLFIYAAPRVQLEGGAPRLGRARRAVPAPIGSRHADVDPRFPDVFLTPSPPFAASVRVSWSPPEHARPSRERRAPRHHQLRGRT